MWIASLFLPIAILLVKAVPDVSANEVELSPEQVRSVVGITLFEGLNLGKDAKLANTITKLDKVQYAFMNNRKVTEGVALDFLETLLWLNAKKDSQQLIVATLELPKYKDDGSAQLYASLMEKVATKMALNEPECAKENQKSASNSKEKICDFESLMKKALGALEAREQIEMKLRAKHLAILTQTALLYQSALDQLAVHEEDAIEEYKKWMQEKEYTNQNNKQYIEEKETEAQKLAPGVETAYWLAEMLEALKNEYQRILGDNYQWNFVGMLQKVKVASKKTKGPISAQEMKDLLKLINQWNALLGLQEQFAEKKVLAF